jgi:catechol 2,3-dioxygenase-like lactoylglutathione lyase family enzyme
MSKSNYSHQDKASAHDIGLPGLRGTEHIGFTVPNLAEAVDFFVNVIGCEPFYELGPFSSDGEWMQTALNVHPRAVMKKLQFLRCGNGSNFEIFEYSSPDQNPVQPRNSDVGGHHLAFYVDDIDSAVQYLRMHDVRILGEPVARKDGPRANLGLFPDTLGNAARARILPEWQGL